MRNGKRVLLMILMTVFMAGAILCAQEEVLNLKHGAFGERQRHGVTFSHSTHFATIDCTECHHFYVNGQNVWNESLETNCAACHGLKAEGSKGGLMKAFHQGCMGCHRKVKSAAGKTLPVMCGQCHVRSKS